MHIIKKYTKIIVLVLSVLVAYGAFSFFKLSDLRPENYTYPNNPDKARSLLKEMGEAHGISYWDSIQTYTINFEDEFYGFLGKQAHPFKEQKIVFEFQYIPNTFNGQLKITSGEDKGLVWGIQEGQTYTYNQSGAVSAESNSDMQFWIPTYQYFIEFPKRIQEATVVDYIGSKNINGVLAEGVIASWKSVAPQSAIDQYVVWIAADTKRIVKIEYTVRDAYNFITGAASFKNYKTYNGLLLPSNFPVESNLVKEGEMLHEMRIKKVQLNTSTKSALTPL